MRLLTDDLLRRIMPASQSDRRARFLAGLNDAMREFEITTPQREACFLAQVCAESGSLTYDREIWGPTAAQRGYEGRRDLGNTQPGDGFRFRGIGLIQVTGRANTTRAGVALGLDLANHPDLGATPGNAPRLAAWFFATHGCLPYADKGDILAVSRIVNVGHAKTTVMPNGWTTRRDCYACALPLLQAVPEDTAVPTTPTCTVKFSNGQTLTAEIDATNHARCYAQEFLDKAGVGHPLVTELATLIGSDTKWDAATRTLSVN